MTIAASLLPVYRRCDIMMVRGEGVLLYDDQGNDYLDFASGIATNALGHNHPALVEALHTQSEQLWHCSNLFRNEPLEAFADQLIASCFADHVFFGSSGTEVVEAAIKTVRRYHYVNDASERTVILAMDGAFHGRSTGALAACSHAASKVGFEPLMPGVRHVPFHDIDALHAAMAPDVAAVMLEPIQGEGGVRVHSDAYLREVRTLCDEQGILLFLDEIQCGYGRTGTLFAHEPSGIVPDIVTCAKGIGGGFPLSAMLCTAEASKGMTQGTHGSTYGSNPLACAVGKAVLDAVQADGFLAHVRDMGTLLHEALCALVGQYPALFADTRGVGLMQGLVLQPDIDKYELSAALRADGLLVSPAVTHVVRILPPLITQSAHIERMTQHMQRICADF